MCKKLCERCTACVTFDSTLSNFPLKKLIISKKRALWIAHILPFCISHIHSILWKVVNNLMFSLKTTQRPFASFVFVYVGKSYSSCTSVANSFVVVKYVGPQRKLWAYRWGRHLVKWDDFSLCHAWTSGVISWKVNTVH